MICSHDLSLDAKLKRSGPAECQIHAKQGANAIGGSLREEYEDGVVAGPSEKVGEISHWKCFLGSINLRTDKDIAINYLIWHHLYHKGRSSADIYVSGMTHDDKFMSLMDDYGIEILPAIVVSADSSFGKYLRLFNCAFAIGLMCNDFSKLRSAMEIIHWSILKNASLKDLKRKQLAQELIRGLQIAEEHLALLTTAISPVK